MAMRQHDAIRPKDRGEWTMFRQKRMDRRIKFIYPFDLAEHCQQQSNLTDQRLIYSNCQSLQVH